MRDWMIPTLLIVILLVFGARRLPDMAQSIGQSLRILRRESNSDQDSVVDQPPGRTSGERAAQRIAEPPPAIAPPPAVRTPGRGTGVAGADVDGERRDGRA